jgi:hypothetical protein
MKASFNNATIILPFSHASDAAGFFLGKSPKSSMDFSLLKCISTCQRQRYVSRSFGTFPAFQTSKTAGNIMDRADRNERHSVE